MSTVINVLLCKRVLLTEIWCMCIYPPATVSGLCWAYIGVFHQWAIHNGHQRPCQDKGKSHKGWSCQPCMVLSLSVEKLSCMSRWHDYIVVQESNLNGVYRDMSHSVQCNPIFIQYIPNGLMHSSFRHLERWSRQCGFRHQGEYSHQLRLKRRLESMYVWNYVCYPFY